MKKGRGLIIGAAMLIFAFLGAGGYLISVPVMATYSKIFENMWKPSLEVKMPSGLSTPEKDWYPLVMTYLDTGVGKALGTDAKMLIKYNYGAFRGSRSEFYNVKSKYFLSFYGCYIISISDGSLGLLNADGSWDLEKLEKIPRYDMDLLILESIGCKNPDTTYQITSVQDGVELCGYSGWTRFDANVYTNSSDHKMTSFHRGYFHFGFPPGIADEDYSRVEMKGRMYARYFEEESEYLFFYVIGKEDALIQETDENFLRRSVIEIQTN